jgi:hypothetical protein
MVARVLAGAIFVTTLGIASPSYAQAVDAAPSLRTAVTDAFLTARAVEDQFGGPVTTSRPTPVSFDAPRSSTMVLNSLYAATATMQMLDVHSTVKALDRGAVEANPLMAGLVQHRAAFVAAKVGVAALSIYAAKRLARNNRVGAIATMVALNSAYAMIVANNYRNARR